MKLEAWITGWDAFLPLSAIEIKSRVYTYHEVLELNL